MLIATSNTLRAPGLGSSRGLTILAWPQAHVVLDPEVADRRVERTALQLDLVEIDDFFQSLSFAGKVPVTDLVEHDDPAFGHQRKERLERHLGRPIEIGVEDQHCNAE